MRNTSASTGPLMLLSSTASQAASATASTFTRYGDSVKSRNRSSKFLGVIWLHECGMSGEMNPGRKNTGRRKSRPSRYFSAVRFDRIYSGSARPQSVALINTNGKRVSDWELLKWVARTSSAADFKDAKFSSWKLSLLNGLPDDNPSFMDAN